MFEGTTAVFVTIPAAGEVTAETFAALKPSVKRMFTREKDGAAEGAYGLSFALVGEEVRGVLFQQDSSCGNAAEKAKGNRSCILSSCAGGDRRAVPSDANLARSPATTQHDLTYCARRPQTCAAPSQAPGK